MVRPIHGCIHFLLALDSRVPDRSFCITLRARCVLAVLRGVSRALSCTFNALAFLRCRLRSPRCASSAALSALDTRAALSALHSLRCDICAALSALRSPHCALRTALSALRSPRCALHAALYAPRSSRRALRALHAALFAPHFFSPPSSCRVLRAVFHSTRLS